MTQHKQSIRSRRDKPTGRNGPLANSRRTASRACPASVAPARDFDSNDGLSARLLNGDVRRASCANQKIPSSRIVCQRFRNRPIARNDGLPGFMGVRMRRGLSNASSARRLTARQKSNVRPNLGERSMTHKLSASSGLSPGGATVSSPGRKPWDEATKEESHSPEGATLAEAIVVSPYLALPPLWGLSGIRISPFAQGLTPLATHCRPLRGLKTALRRAPQFDNAATAGCSIGIPNLEFHVAFVS
jgi:hypothetical protein